MNRQDAIDVRIDACILVEPDFRLDPLSIDYEREVRPVIRLIEQIPDRNQVLNAYGAMYKPIRFVRRGRIGRTISLVFSLGSWCEMEHLAFPPRPASFL